MTSDNDILHASCVSWESKGVVILGAAGAGKSTLALQLIGLGCDLIADDRTIVTRVGPQLSASCPEAIKGQIEARGMGILLADSAEQTTLICAISLDEIETARYPDERHVEICGVSLRLFHKPETMAFPEAVLQYLKNG